MLEGALDLEINRKRLSLVYRTTAAAIIGTILCILCLAPAVALFLWVTPLQALLIATPFAVISSAVAISATSMLRDVDKEFVVYESSLSDILGVIIFFAVLGSNGTLTGMLVNLLGGGFISIVISVVSAMVLTLLLLRADSQIRFIPLLAGLFALYSIGKLLHFSPLIMVLILGVLLNRPTIITRLPMFRNWIPSNYYDTLAEFKTLVIELTFVVRGFFFILLGYWTEPKDFLSLKAWIAAAIVLTTIYPARFILLRWLTGVERARTLMWIAPRGLITVLLFVYVKDAVELPNYFSGSTMLIVLITSILMLVPRYIAGMEEEAAIVQGDTRRQEDSGGPSK